MSLLSRFRSLCRSLVVVGCRFYGDRNIRVRVARTLLSAVFLKLCGIWKTMCAVLLCLIRLRTWCLILRFRLSAQLKLVFLGVPTMMKKAFRLLGGASLPGSVRQSNLLLVTAVSISVLSIGLWRS